MLSLILYVVLAVFALLYALIGLLRGAKKSIASLACGVIALGVAILVTIVVCNSVVSAIDVNEVLTRLETSGIVNAEILSFINVFPSLLQNVTQLIMAIVSPILFIISFVLVSFILLCFRALLLLPFKKINDENKAPSRLIGLGTGLVKGLIVVFVLFAPIAGYLGIVDTVINSAETIMEEAEYQKMKSDYENITGGATDNVALNAVKTLGGQAIFDSITSIKINGQRGDITTEINVIIDAVSKFRPLLSGGGENGEIVLNKETIDSLKDMLSDDSENSVLVQNAVVDAVTGISNAWLNGEEFMGMTKPEVDPYIDPIIDSVLGIYADTTVETLGNDVGVILDMMGILMDSGALGGEGEGEASGNPMDIFTDEEVITTIIESVEATGKSEQIIGAITDSAVAIIGEQIGIKDADSESYKDIVDGAADIMNEALASEDPSAFIEQKISDMIGETEFEVPATLLPYVADKFVESFVDMDSVTSDDIKAFIEGKYDLIHGNKN